VAERLLMLPNDRLFENNKHTFGAVNPEQLKALVSH